MAAYQERRYSHFLQCTLSDAYDLSALQELKGHLTTAIDVLSNLEGQSVEYRLDAIRTLNSFVAALSLNDGDHYEAMDMAFEDVIKR